MNWIKGTAGALVCGLIMAGALSANAQAAKGKSHHGQPRVKIAQVLGLTDSQKEQLKPILKDARAQKKAIDADTKLTREEKRAKLKDLHKDTQEKIGAILTPEQKEKWAELRKEHHRGKKL